MASINDSYPPKNYSAAGLSGPRQSDGKVGSISVATAVSQWKLVVTDRDRRMEADK